MPGSYDHYFVIKVERATPTNETRVREYNALGQATRIFEDDVSAHGLHIYVNRLDLQPSTAINNTELETDQKSRECELADYIVTTKRYQIVAVVDLLLAGAGLLPQTFRDTLGAERAVTL